MDANGTRYKLLLGQPDWEQLTLDETLQDSTQQLSELWADPAPLTPIGVDWNHNLHEITLQPRLFRFVTSENDNPPQREDRRGSARDQYGNWYWIDEAQTGLYVQSSGSGDTTHFWSLDETEPEAPRFGMFRPKETQSVTSDTMLQGLTVSKQHYLVVGMLNPAGLLIFDLHGGGTPERILWNDVPFAPYDMTASPDGGLWILDQDNMRLWALDAHFNICNRDLTYSEEEQDANFFIAKDIADTAPDPEATVIQVPAGIALDAASPLSLIEPIAIVCLPDNTVLILDAHSSLDFSLVYRYYFGEQLGEPVSLQVVQSMMPDAMQFVAHDFAFVPEHEDEGDNAIPDRLAVMNSEGNQVFFFDLSLTEDGALAIAPVIEYYPVRLFGGKAIVASDNAVYYDFEDRWLPVVARRRKRFLAQATVFTTLFDAGIPQCVWHRALLDMCLPPNTQVVTASRAADTESDLLNSSWFVEPVPYRRHQSELPFVEQGGSEWYGTFETLLQNAVGRFLQIRLTLSGNEERSPSIRALRLYYPRFSYLDNYLPALYRDHAESASFLDRFLANTEGIFTAIEDRIAAAQILLDVRSAPADTLDWLASWFGITLNLEFDVSRQRLFIKYAMQFFQMRGTIRGLLTALQLAFDDCADETIFTDPVERARRSGVRIVESYTTRRMPAVVVGDPTQTNDLTFIPPSERWHPDQGATELHNRYANFMSERGHPEEKIFPLKSFENLELEAERQHFARTELGIVPSITDDMLWQDYLRRLYENDLQSLNTAHNYMDATKLTGFSTLTLPQTLPSKHQVLSDWFTFQTVLLPMHTTAHHFLALIPLPRTTFVDAAEQQRLITLAQRVIDLEKPTHTTYDVRFYYDLFRLGEVRLGFDTAIEEGSRSTRLLAPAVLGQAHLVESYLAPEHPQNISNRQVTGCDRNRRSGEDIE